MEKLYFSYTLLLLLFLIVTGNFQQQPVSVYARGGGGGGGGGRGGGFSAARGASVASVARASSVASTGARGMSAARSATIFASGRPSPGAISASSSIAKSSSTSSLSVGSGRTAPYGSASGSRSSSYAVPVFVGGYHGGGGGSGGYYGSSGSSGSFVGAQNGTFRSVDNQDRVRLSAALLAATILVGGKYIVQKPALPIQWSNRSLYWDAEFIQNNTRGKDSENNTMICRFPVEKVANNGSETTLNSSTVFDNIFIKKNTTDVSSSSNENNDDLRHPELAWKCDGQREVCCWLDCCPAADFPAQDCGSGGDDDDCAASGAEITTGGLAQPLFLVTTLFAFLTLSLAS